MELKSILVSGAFGGAAGWIMFIVLRSLQRRAIDKLPHANKQFASEVEQDRKADFECNFEDIFQETINAIRTIDKSKVLNADKEAMLILAKTGLNWKTLGDKIKVSFEEKGTNHVSVQITSKPRLWTTTIDYGKNFDNVEKILAHLSLRYERI